MGSVACLSKIVRTLSAKHVKQPVTQQPKSQPSE
jgi:hypothetical protein